MLNLLDKIIEETNKDDRLFARYGFKFYDCMEKYPNESRLLLEKEPKFKNDFQRIFLSGLVEHFYKLNQPKWVSSKKLKTNWKYLSQYNNEEKFLPELTKRGIYAI